MDFYLQFGYGMMAHCRSLVGDWKGGTVILSPRDLSVSQLRKLAKEVRSLDGGRVLLDPQFYLPHADHERLRSHGYWPSAYATGVFWQGSELARMIGSLRGLNDELGCDRFILPGLLGSRIDDDWLLVQELVIEEGGNGTAAESLIPTIALSADALRSEEQVARLIDRAAAWNVGAYYIVAEHPGGKYLVDDPAWLANLLDVAAGLRMRGAEVILGYCNQQMLVAACAKVTAIASGTWMNVRSFPPEKFRNAYEEEIRQRSTWYYCPQALSEYKVPFLDIAHRLGVLNQMRPSQDVEIEEVAALFHGVQPSSTGFTEQAAFRHFLKSLRAQTLGATKTTFAETVAHHEGILEGAENLLRALTGAGVRGQLRDFSEAIDVNRAALAAFSATRGVVLARKWSAL